MAVVYDLRVCGSESARPEGLKSIAQVHDDAPVLGGPMLAFIDRSARYICAPVGRVLSMVLGGSGVAVRPATRVVLAVSGVFPERMTPQRQRVLDIAQTRMLGMAALAQEARVSPSTVSGLVSCGALIRRRIEVDDRFDRPDATGAPPYDLTSAQAEAVGHIDSALTGGGFRPVVLDGVTGSGKTSVYTEAIARVLSSSATAQVLVLTPEIALAGSVAAHLGKRFATTVPLWHAEVSASVKRSIWRESALGRLRIVVGARSALFLPFAELSLIVVDEEHDASYKQDQGVIYQARDLSVLRASMEKSAIVLASATPSVETLYNIEAGRYLRIELPDRYGGAGLPDVALTDLRRSRPGPGKYLSADLVAATNRTLEAGEQVLYFLNRRGYAPLVICRSCGHRLKSPDTDSWLSEHRATGRLVCHVTGFSMPMPRLCPRCRGEDTLVGVGPGVERICEEAHGLFPGVRIEVFSSDSASERTLHPDVISRMERGHTDILIGTQIVAKGHHFPKLTLVGVIDADSGLSGIDFRASERTWQLLSQVSGRAGRADLPGRAMIQTHLPDTAVLQALIGGDRDAFISSEMAARRHAGMPPYGRLAAMVVSAPRADGVDRAARNMALAVRRIRGIDVWGPAPAQISVLRGRHRRRFLVRADRSVDISEYMRQWRQSVRHPASVRVVVDIDPYHFA